MVALVEIQWWHWVAFVVAVLFLLALDLGIIHRKAHVVHFGEALSWTAAWFVLAMGFALLLKHLRGSDDAVDFVNGYLIELSLSMDNVFVMAVIFGYFKVPSLYQHRVLFWGIIGALLMRGLMIWLGVELIHSYRWMLYAFGVFLVLTGIRMLLPEEEDAFDPQRNPILRLAQRYFHVTQEYDGQKLFTLEQGKRVLTPLALVLILVESMDLMFALDSIPAILGVTDDTFIVFTSNVFAILGLRSLYFVLAGAISYFRYLKYGLSAVLAFIGFKMLIVDWYKIPGRWALFVVIAIIFTAMAVSWIAMWREQRSGKAGRPSEPNR